MNGLYKTETFRESHVVKTDNRKRLTPKQRRVVKGSLSSIGKKTKNSKSELQKIYQCIEDLKNLGYIGRFFAWLFEKTVVPKAESMVEQQKQICTSVKSFTRKQILV